MVRVADYKDLLLGVIVDGLASSPPTNDFPVPLECQKYGYEWAKDSRYGV
jgi:hypothetical protein